MDKIELSIKTNNKSEVLEWDLNKTKTYEEMLETVVSDWNNKYLDNPITDDDICIIIPKNIYYSNLFCDTEELFYFLKFIDVEGDVNDESNNEVFLKYLEALGISVPDNLEDFNYYYRNSQELYYGCFCDEEELIRDYFYNVLGLTWETIDLIIDYFDYESFINNTFVYDDSQNYYYYIE